MLATRPLLSAGALVENVANRFLFGAAPPSSALTEGFLSANSQNYSTQIIQTCETVADLDNVKKGIKEYRYFGSVIKPGVAGAMIAKCIELNELSTAVEMLHDNRRYGLFPTTTDYNKLCKQLNSKQMYKESKMMFDQLVVDRLYPPNTVSYDLLSRASFCIGTTAMCSKLIQYIYGGMKDSVQMNANTFYRCVAASAIKRFSKSASKFRELAKEAPMDQPWLLIDESVKYSCLAIAFALEKDEHAFHKYIDDLISLQLNSTPPEAVHEAISRLEDAGLHLDDVSSLTLGTTDADKTDDNEAQQTNGHQFDNNKQ
eukprot:gene8593-7771_t